MLELLNKVCELANWFCLQGVRVVRANRRDGFGLGGTTVLVGWGGHLVSFCRTVVDIEDYFWGLGIVALKINL